MRHARVRNRGSGYVTAGLRWNLLYIVLACKLEVWVPEKTYISTLRGECW